MEREWVIQEINTKVLLENLMERGHVGDLCVHQRILLKWTFKKHVDSSGSLWGPVAGSSRHDNISSCSIKGGHFLKQLSDCWLLKNNSLHSLMLLLSVYIYLKVLLWCFLVTQK